MAFHFSFEDKEAGELAVLTLSRASAATLLVVYAIYLVFLLKPKRQCPGPLDEEDVQSEHESIGPPAPITPPQPATIEDPPAMVLNRTIKFADEHDPRSLLRPSVEDDDEAAGPWTYNREESAMHSASIYSHASRDDLHSGRVESRAGSVYSRRRSRSRSRSLSRGSFSTLRRPRHSDIVERYVDRGRRSLSGDRTRESSPHGSTRGDGSGVCLDESPLLPISRTTSMVLLVVTTLLVALCADYVVDSISTIVETTPLTQSFIGLIILPIAGNAAEYLTAVNVAARGKLDLAIGVSFGSSIQIAILVTPLMVLVAWAMQLDMSLYLGLFETATLVGSALLVNILIANGKTNYLEGTLLCACYIMIA
jgi:Ca2+/H+ antiporter